MTGLPADLPTTLPGVTRLYLYLRELPPGHVYKHAEAARALGVGARSVWAWFKLLRQAGHVGADRARYGCLVRVATDCEARNELRLSESQRTARLATNCDSTERAAQVGESQRTARLAPFPPDTPLSHAAAAVVGARAHEDLGITGGQLPNAPADTPAALLTDVRSLAGKPRFLPEPDFYRRVGELARRIRQFDPDWSLCDEVLKAIERKGAAQVTAGNVLNALDQALKFARKRAGGRPIAQRVLLPVVDASRPPRREPAEAPVPLGQTSPMRSIDRDDFERFLARSARGGAAAYPSGASA